MGKIVKTKFALISLAHFIVDSVPLYFPVYVVMADLDIAKAGMISTLAKLLSNGLQPFFGFIADRFRGKALILLALLVAPLFVSLIGTTRNYYLLAFFFLVGSMGVSLFHPAGASVAHSLGGSSKNMAFSFFVLVGTIGYALGQPIFTGFDAWFGKEHSYWLACPALIFTAIYFIAGPAMSTVKERVRPFYFLQQVKANIRPLAILYLFVVIRGGVFMGFNFALPTLLKAAGYPTVIYAGGGSLIFNLSGILLLPLAGYLADRWGEKWVIVLSMLGGTPFMILFLYLGSQAMVPALVCLGAGSCILAASNPIGVVMGQNLTPRSEATISSFLMGFGWAVGSVAPFIIGYFSKKAGVFVLERLIFNLTVLACIPLLIGLMGFLLPRKKVRAEQGKGYL